MDSFLTMPFIEGLTTEALAPSDPPVIEEPAQLTPTPTAAALKSIPEVFDTSQQNEELTST